MYIYTHAHILQNSVGKESEPAESAEDPKINLTLSQLVSNFDNIFRGIAKREGLNDPCHISIGVNQIRTFLDEFGKARCTMFLLLLGVFSLLSIHLYISFILFFFFYI